MGQWPLGHIPFDTKDFSVKKIALAITAFVAAAPLILGSGAAFAATTYTPSLVKQFDTSNDSGFAVDSIVTFSDTQAIVSLDNGDLWLTDGTPSGTTDITQAASDAGLTDWNLRLSTWQRNAIADGAGNLYFTGRDADGWNIWKFNGTVFTQVSTENFEWISEIYLLDGNVYLWGRNYDENYLDDTLYQVALPSGAATEIIGGNYCDGAHREARQVSFVDPYIVFANDELNNCSYALMSWDTTNPGNNPVDLSVATGASGYDTEFAQWDDRYVWNGELYFGGRTTNGDYELWTTDGTLAGTSLLKDINVGSGSGYPGWDGQMWFTEYNGELYFSANDGTDYYMFKTDGTDSGTVKAVTTLPDPNDSAEGPGVAFDGKLAVTFYDPAHGEELFLTDGTDAGTTLIKDVNTNGTDGSMCWGNCVVPVAFDNHLFFVAHDGTNNSVWVSDGTDAGTTEVTNFEAEYAIGNSNEFALVQLGTHLLFGVSDYSGSGGTGEMALYTLDASPALAKTGADIDGLALAGLFALIAGAGVYAIRRRVSA